MKELLVVISLLISGGVTQSPSGPYPPSGWKPSGPAFELPPSGSQQQPAEYLPPLDPRNTPNTPSAEYGPPQEPSNSNSIPSVEYGVPGSPSGSASTPNASVSPPQDPNVTTNMPDVGSSIPQDPSVSVNDPSVGFSQDPRNAANIPSVGLGIPQDPCITVNTPGPSITASASGVAVGIPQGPGVAFGIPQGPNVGFGLPLGPSITATAPNVGLGFPQVPSVGLGFPQGPSISATAPGIGFGLPQGPGVTATAPGIGLGVSPDLPVDVSVQGLPPPQKEAVPLFQASPVSGLPSIGFGFNAHIKSLNQNAYQKQYQQQQENYREFERQRQLDAHFVANRLEKPERLVFAARITPATTETSTAEETTMASTTEFRINVGETLELPKGKEKVTVELTAQKNQEYPGEFFLSSLAQLQLQPQLAPLQFDQLKSPLFSQPQQQIAGFDAKTHFAALPSIIAQQKLQPQVVMELQPIRGYQQPQLRTEQDIESVVQYQPQQLQPQVQPQPQLQQQPFSQYVAQSVQLQPQSVQFIPRPAQFQPQPVQFQPQLVQFQPQPFQPQPDNFDAENIDQNSYQPQIYQQQFLAPQPVNQPQPGYIQAQLIKYPGQDASKLQNQFQQQTQFLSLSQGADATKFITRPAQFQPQPIQFQPQLVQFQPQPFQPQPDNIDAENIDQNSYQPQIYQQQFLAPQPVNQPQPGYIQAQLIKYPGQDASKLLNQFQQQTQFPSLSQGADATKFITRPAQFQPQPIQFQPQLVQFQPQPFQPQPDNIDAENIDQNSYQHQIYQQQFLAPQPVNRPQPGYIQAQLIKYPGQDVSKLHNQFQQQTQFPSLSQGADALQSGFDVNQQGNDIDEPQNQEEDRNEGTTVTAIATAFGTRSVQTRPEMYSKYGAPSHEPKVQVDHTRATTESPAEVVTDEEPVIAQAVAIADGTRKKSVKLRSIRVRPILTLGKSGHLVLEQT